MWYETGFDVVRLGRDGNVSALGKKQVGRGLVR